MVLSRLFTFMTTLLVLLFICSDLQSQTNTRDYQFISDSNSKSIVKIEAKTRNGEISTGSGIVIDSLGSIATCFHVIAGAQRINVISDDGKIYQVIRISMDILNDIAILKITENNLTPIEFNQNVCNDGEDVCIISNPGTLINVFDCGTILRYRGAGLMTLNVTAARGSSGGGVFSSDGKLIGMISKGLETERITMAIPVLKIATHLQKGKFISFPYNTPEVNCEQLLDDAISSISQGTTLYAHAFNNLHQVLIHCPNNPTALYYLAVLYYDLGNFQAALTYYTRSLDYQQELSDLNELHNAYFNRGVALMELDLYEQAISDFQRSAEIFPIYYNKANFNIYSCYFNLNDCENALHYFYMIPDSFLIRMVLIRSTWRNVIYCLNEVQPPGYQDKIEHIVSIINNLPIESPTYFYNTALEQYSSGQIQDAKKTLLKGLQKYPGNAKLNYLLGNIYLEQSLVLGDQVFNTEDLISSYHYLSVAFNIDRNRRYGIRLITSCWVNALNKYYQAVDKFNLSLTADDWENNSAINSLLDDADFYQDTAKTNRFFNADTNIRNYINSLDTNIRLMRVEILFYRNRDNSTDLEDALDSISKYFPNPQNCEISLLYSRIYKKLNRITDALNYVNRSLNACMSEYVHDKRCCCNAQQLKISLYNNMQNYQEAFEVANDPHFAYCNNENRCYTFYNLMRQYLKQEDYLEIVALQNNQPNLIDSCQCANWYIALAYLYLGDLEKIGVIRDGIANTADPNYQTVMNYYNLADSYIDESLQNECPKNYHCIKAAILNSKGQLIEATGNHRQSGLMFLEAKRINLELRNSDGERNGRAYGDMNNSCNKQLLNSYLFLASVYTGELVQRYEDCINICTEGLNYFPDNVDLSYSLAFSYYQIAENVPLDQKNIYLRNALDRIKKIITLFNRNHNPDPDEPPIERTPQYIRALRLGYKICIKLGDEYYDEACQYCDSIMAEPGHNFNCREELKLEYGHDCPE